MGRGRKATPADRQKFLDALAETGIVTIAAKSAGITRTSVYAWRAEEPEFRAEWEKALELGLDAMEDEGRRRAMHGVRRSIYYQGQEVGSQQDFSDVLLMFMLKGRRPEIFKDRMHVEHEAVRDKIERLKRGKERVERGIGDGSGS